MQGCRAVLLLFLSVSCIAEWCCRWWHHDVGFWWDLVSLEQAVSRVQQLWLPYDLLGISTGRVRLQLGMDGSALDWAELSFCVLYGVV